MRKSNKQFAGVGMTGAIGIGTVIAILISFISSGFVAALISGGHYEENSMSLARLAVQFISAVLGALVAGNIAKEKKTLCCIMTDTLYIFALIAIAILFFSGISMSVIGGVVVCSVGCISAIFVTNSKINRRPQRKSRRGSR